MVENSKLKKIFVSLAILTFLLSILQNYNKQQEFLAAVFYKHHENQKIVQELRINTTTTTNTTLNNHSNYIDYQSLQQTTTLPTRQNEQQHGNSSDIFLQQMLLDENKKQLRLSARHQQKFMSQKLHIEKIFPPAALYRAVSGKLAAIVLNQKWAYIHVWKSGGSTIEKQTGRGQKRLDHVQIQNRHLWMTLVRDPIDHFLSGWAECGMRRNNKQQQQQQRRPWIASKYDGRIREYLNDTRIAMASNLQFLSSSMPQRYLDSCTRHSFPQANFLLNEHGQIHDKLKVIGDLHEIVDVLKLVGFDYNATIGEARTAAGDDVKRKFFPVNKHLLSNETLREICKFVAIDYYLFDFQPPPACDDSMFPGHH